VLIDVKAFGLNHAEIYFRQGWWGDVAEISGIECVGCVKAHASGRFRPGQKVVAMVGGMGRSLNGSYAELTYVPASNVVAVETSLSWEILAAIPESYATAWTSLVEILSIRERQSVVVRGGTSGLGRVAINIASYLGAHVIATTRKPERAAHLKALGANEVLLDNPSLSVALREVHSDGIDAVLDIIGSTTVLDSLAMLRRGGAVCVVGFLGGGGALSLKPIFQIPGGRWFDHFRERLGHRHVRFSPFGNSFSDNYRPCCGRRV
jgi:NADPH:quinone reductase